MRTIKLDDGRCMVQVDLGRADLMKLLNMISWAENHCAEEAKAEIDDYDYRFATRWLESAQEASEMQKSILEMLEKIDRLEDEELARSCEGS